MYVHISPVSFKTLSAVRSNGLNTLLTGPQMLYTALASESPCDGDVNLVLLPHTSGTFAAHDADACLV